MRFSSGIKAERRPSDWTIPYRVSSSGRAYWENSRLKANDIKPWGSLSWPNRISILRLVLVFPFLVLLINQNDWSFARHTALGIFIVMAVSDLLDGMLARRLNQRTRLGAILDPLADKALIIFSVLLLSLDQAAVPGARISNWVVVAIVGKDIWVIAGFIVIYLVTDRFRIEPTLVGKVSTFGQLVMVGLVLVAPDVNAAIAGFGTRLAQISSWMVAGLSAAAAINYTRLGLRFVAEGQKPLESNSEKEKRSNEFD